MEILQIVERVGAYAGLAAVVGLAVLSALYFSQARDLKRLREWAGRAPERLPRSEPARTTGARPLPRQGAPAAKGRPAGAPSDARATPAGAGAAGAGVRTGAPRPAPATAVASSEGGVATAAPSSAPPSAAPAADDEPEAAEAAPAPRPPGPRPPTGPRPAVASGGRPATSRPTTAPPLRARTAAAAAPAAEPERRGMAPRYAVLLAAGVLILGGGIAFGVVQYTSVPTTPPPPPATPARNQPIVPAQVTVSVLNGTTQPGLAAQIGDKVESGGFRLGNVTNAGDQQRAESVVLYVAGAAREARAVGRELDIEQTERAENGERTLAGSARVIVVVGADMVQP